MSLKDTITETQRLLTLQALQQDEDYALSDIMLQAFLKEVGENMSIDAIRTQGAWLAEQQLVTANITPRVHIFKLTNRALDVLSGAFVPPGIARPRPE